MAKRFCDTDLWQKEWFQELSLKHKVLLKYIFENCDCAGIWETNFRFASFIIGETVTLQDLKEINEKKEQFIFIEDNKIFVKDFIDFQYGKLSFSCKPHIPVIKILQKYNIDFECIDDVKVTKLKNTQKTQRVLKKSERVLDTLSEISETLEEKEKEKEQEQYKEKDKEKEVSSLVLSSLSEKKQNDLKMYGKYNNVALSAEQYNHSLALCASEKLLQELIDSLSENIETGKEQAYRAEFPNAHYIRLDKYRSYRTKHPEQFNARLQQRQAQLQQPPDRSEIFEKLMAQAKAEGKI